MISVQGPEAFGKDFVPRAVDGGTGHFRNAGGEMTDVDFDDHGFLVVKFKLITDDDSRDGDRKHRR